MCLAVPGKLICWIDRDVTFARGEVEFEGIRRVCHLACVTEADEGDFVLVHAGVAITRVDPVEAERLFEDLRRIGNGDAWREGLPS